MYDLFVSYRHADRNRVVPLVEALRRASLSVWIDQREIDDFASITRSITEGLAKSKALLGWYSRAYPLSRACQWELTAAFIAAQQDGDPRRRVLVVNPEVKADHIHPIELQDAVFEHAPVLGDGAGLHALTSTLKQHLDGITGLLGEIRSLSRPEWHGQQPVGSNRFVGRLADLWRIHSALHASENAIISGVASGAIAQLSGMGGIGKSLLAEEYALRFGAAYPGGVFWVRASDQDKDTPGTISAVQDAAWDEQIRAFALRLGVAVEGLKPDEIEARFVRKLEDRGLPYLWVVDDVPAGLSADGLRRWWAPQRFGKTLLTTRSREYDAMGKSLPLRELSPEESYRLLTFRRTPKDAEEKAAAQEIAQDLGHHPLALDVASAALKGDEGLRSFAEFRTSLQDPRQDELKFAAELKGELPNGHEKSIAATLLRSIRRLEAEGLDLLRLASVLTPRPFLSH
jgi:hypothetical protein